MLRFIVGVFVVLHGLVHLLYSAHSHRLLELRPGMVWPEGSWVFSKLLGDGTTRLLASVLYLLATAGFVVGGIGSLVTQAWWRSVVVGSAAFSAGIIVVFWDGDLQNLADKGLFGLLINVAILIALLMLS